MTKQEYMNSLREKLKIFEEALALEIIEDYESHFIEGLENGKSEEAVSKELGDIDEIVAELEQLYKTLPEKKILKSIDKDVKTDSIINEVKDNALHETTDDNKAYQNPDYTNTFNFNTEQFSEAYSSELSRNNIPVKKLILESNCAQVNIRPSFDNNFALNYNNEGSLKQKMMYRFFGNQKGDTFYGRVFHENGIGKFFSFSSQPDIVIDISLPKNMDLVEIKGLSGDIESRGASADEIKINTASGDVLIEHSNCKNIDISSLSGDIDTDSINCGYISLVSKSGDVSVKNVLINKSIVKSLSGSIDIKNLKGLDVYADTASGDIEIMDIAAEDVKLATNSGDIEFNNGTMKSLTVNTTSGDVTASSITTERIDASSISGDIELRSKTNYINSRSTSGDISIINESVMHGDINTISGEVDIRIKSVSNGYKANVSTLSGEIELRLLSENYCSQPRNGTHIVGNGASEIKVKTMSGDICISD